MMKKLLVLSLVLGIASLASAGLVTEVTPGEIALSTDMAISGFDVSYVVTSGDLTLDDIGVTAGLAFDFATGVITDSATEARISGSQFLSPATGPGVLFSGLAYQLTEISTVDVIDQLGGGNVIETLTIIPEPATMALLGLGALVLRRKK